MRFVLTRNICWTLERRLFSPGFFRYLISHGQLVILKKRTYRDMLFINIRRYGKKRLRRKKSIWSFFLKEEIWSKAFLPALLLRQRMPMEIRSHCPERLSTGKRKKSPPLPLYTKDVAPLCILLRTERIIRLRWSWMAKSTVLICRKPGCRDMSCKLIIFLRKTV